MPASGNEPRRQAIARTLAQGVGASPGAGAVTDAILGTWQAVARRLAPVIGERGVDVLLRRALHVTSKAYPWLAVGGDHGNSVALLDSLTKRFQSCEAEGAMAAGNELLVTFTDLLASLIGESLTGRLLAPVWSPAPPESEQETST